MNTGNAIPDNSALPSKDGLSCPGQDCREAAQHDGSAQTAEKTPFEQKNEQGHEPTYGVAKRAWLLGAGECPDCRVDLKQTTDGRYACPDCGERYPAIIGGGS